MTDSFSIRLGYKPQPEGGLIYEEAPRALRIGLWNIIQDFLREGGLSTYDVLYNSYTTQLRIARDGKHDREKGVLKMIENCSWYEFFDLCELTFTLLQDVYWYGDLVKEAKDCRYDYTVKLNKIFSEEHIGWRLKKGKLQRVSSELLDRNIIEPACVLLKNLIFSGPDGQFSKALEFYNKRPKPDIENCIKEAVGAIEGVSRIITNRPKDTLGKILPDLVKNGIVKKPLNKIMDSVYGFRGDQPGVGHGQYKPSDLDITDAEFVLNTCASGILFLCKKFEIKQPDLRSGDDMPF